MAFIHNFMTRRAVLGGIAVASTSAVAAVPNPQEVTEPLVEPLYHMVIAKWHENAAFADLADGQEVYIVLRDLARAMAVIPAESVNGVAFKEEVAALRWVRSGYTLSLDFDTAERLRRSAQTDRERLGVPS